MCADTPPWAFEALMSAIAANISESTPLDFILCVLTLSIIPFISLSPPPLPPALAAYALKARSLDRLREQRIMRLQEMAGAYGGPPLKQRRQQLNFSLSRK